MLPLARHFMITGGIAAAVVIAAAVIAPRTAHGSAPSLKQCFAFSQVSNWVAPDPRTLYLRVPANGTYRVDLASQCFPLREHSARLINRSFGPDLVCAPVDLNLSAAGSAGDIPEPCLVKAITLLSRDESAALPKNARP